jgi:hypothetical protein
MKLMTRGSVTTNLFCCPEMIDVRQEYNGVKADIWAAGVTLYYMVYNKYPFYSDHFMHIFDIIKT